MLTNDLGHKSKCLAYLLRHAALPDPYGWVTADLLLERLRITASQLEQIILCDGRGRFEFSKDRSSVRALYGHSIDVDLGLAPTVPPVTLYHGTAEKYLAGIMREGLKSGRRNFVHLSETQETAIRVGARHGNPVVLSVDAGTMAQNGHGFYKARNEVWLTDYIPVRYIKADSHE